jgi:hypothetical protein
MFSLAASTLSRTSRRSAYGLTSRFFHASAADLAKLNVEGLAERVNLEGQNVLVRVDLNVPLSKEVSFFCSFSNFVPIHQNDKHAFYTLTNN